MTNMWTKVSADERRLVELEMEKGDALGRLLGTLDSVLIHAKHPQIYNMVMLLDALRTARDEYDAADKAHRDARIGAL